MPLGVKILKPGLGNSLLDDNGKSYTPPEGWSFLPAGNAGITRKVTKHNCFWRIQIKKGKRFISKGIWAPTRLINEAIEENKSLQSSPDYQKKRAYAAKKREVDHKKYQNEFYFAICSYLNFHQNYKGIEIQMAKNITIFATPIGSGTVARTKMIPIEQRAEKAVIAWMRHHTTPYDNMKIPLIKGERRAVRRKFAMQSIELLQKYRAGSTLNENCPLIQALVKLHQQSNIKTQP